jgi:hypothetical protein
MGVGERQSWSWSRLMFPSQKTSLLLVLYVSSHTNFLKHSTFSNMNTLFLALLFLFGVASSVRGERLSWTNNAQWSSDITMQIIKEGAQAAACSENALSAVKIEVGEWLRDELIDLFGEGAFTLGQVTGIEDGNSISLVASVDCLDCSKVTNKKSIAYILSFFMQHMMDEWIEENNAGVLAGCMGEDTIVSSVLVGGKKAASVV